MANDLAVFEPGRRITLTEQGHRFLISSPARQLWLSLYAWWWVTDWGMAYSWEVFEDFYQSGLSVFSLRVLRGIPVGKRVQVDDFVNIIANMLHTNHVHVNPTLFKSAIKFMILNVLEDFEIITHKKKAKKTSGIPIEEVIWFKVTPFGHQLLRSI